MTSDDKDHKTPGQLDLLAGLEEPSSDGAPIDDGALDDQALDDQARDDRVLDDGLDEGLDDAGYEREDEPTQEEPRPESIAPRVAADLGSIASLRPREARIAGCILGGAIGDAMGHPTEFVSSMRAIRERWGPKGVEGFELFWNRDGRRFAPYTDDTQMAEAVTRALLDGCEKDLGLDATMRAMAERFVEWSKHPQGGHRAPGNACMSGCSALARGTPWSMAGGSTAGGCGSVMRVHPFGLVFADDLDRAERWAVAHSKLTHRDPIALAACAAMAVGIARILRGDTVRTVASEMVAAACRYSPKTAAMMATAIDEAERKSDPEVTFDRLRGWAAHEAIAAALFVFVRHPDDARAAILEGANTPGDSDSIASIAGALVGARVGASGLPAEWVRDVERSDDLLALALRI
jgi:ADP-ribosylglycohydrolase